VKVAYQFVGEAGHFVCHDAEGREIRIEAGQTFSTDDPALIRELDAHPHAVKRVAKGKES
jgi:hypothetical protein